MRFTHNKFVRIHSILCNNTSHDLIDVINCFKTNLFITSSITIVIVLKTQIMRANGIQCVTCKCANCFIAKYCSPKWKRMIDEHKTGRMYKKGQQIFHEGNMIFGIHFICSGKVKVYKSEFDGKNHIVRLSKAGNILGHKSFGSRTYYRFGAETIEDSFISFIENDVFKKLLLCAPELMYNLLLFYAEELRNSETRIRNLAQMNVRERVVETLLMINNIFGQKNDDNWLLNVELPRQDLADITGTSQDQIIRILSEFKKDKIIAFEGKKIIILKYQKLFDMIKGYGLDIYSELPE